MGICPCPRCLVPKSKADCVGLAYDQATRGKGRSWLADSITRARNFIYNLGYGIKSAAVERLLKPTSSTPTKVSTPKMIRIFWLC